MWDNENDATLAEIQACYDTDTDEEALEALLMECIGLGY